VGTAAGGLPEVVDDGRSGFLRPVGDVDGMAEAAVSLLTDPERWSRVSAEARRRAEAEFPTEKLVERYRALYERTLRSSR
jgi:glycosyltransferase involved in cell wall biosynthesis